MEPRKVSEIKTTSQQLFSSVQNSSRGMVATITEYIFVVRMDIYFQWPEESWWSSLVTRTREATEITATFRLSRTIYCVFFQWRKLSLRRPKVWDSG